MACADPRVMPRTTHAAVMPATVRQGRFERVMLRTY